MVSEPTEQKHILIVFLSDFYLIHSPTTNAMSLRKKLVIVGDRSVGKTKIGLMLASKKSEVYVPTVLENYVIDVEVDDTEVELALWDTQGQEDYDRLRPLCYPDTDVVLAVFFIIEPDSLYNAVETWFPEVKHFCPNTPIVLLGYKSDLRNDPATLRKLSKVNQKPVPFEMGEHIANELDAVVYLECSTGGSEIEKILEETVRASLDEILKFHYAKAEKLRMIMVGDTGVGKSCILQQFVQNERSNVFDIPLLRYTRFVWTSAFMEIDGEEFKLLIWDGLSDSSTRTLPNTEPWFLPKKRDVDVFIVTFSVVEPDSYNSIEEKWIPQLKRYYPKAVIVLVGTKTDLRSNSKHHITTDMGEQLAHRINAAKYFECSSTDEKKVEQVFEETVWASLFRVDKRRKKKSRFLRFFQSKLNFKKKFKFF